MYLAIIFLPLLASMSSGFFGRKIGVSGAQFITTSSVVLTTILSSIVFFEVGFNNIPVHISLFKWIDSESLNVLWAFNFDSLTVSMLIPVLIVSSLVHLYSIGYMSHDPHNQRFFSYLSLFTFMMIILVTANNYLLMFVGWEGVGICSYLLVSFWFTRIAANQSSMSALLTNRVGDCFLTIGMFALLWSFGNIDYTTVFSLAPYMNENIVTIIGICLLIGAMAKSSQIGLHVWLPQAMEGPTPVSALIHAATMVTAGVYLLMRSSPLIEYSSTVLLLCLWVGAFTTVFSSLIGLFQQDIKKVIAYSTMSQLGMMVIAIGLSSYNIALFHLVNHAFYKALLFLGAGAVIHAVADNQDFRKYGGLRHFLPLTYSVMLIASLSLVAFPFMTGFYSKDFILESSYGQYQFSSTVVYFIATIGAIFTTLYSVKVLYLTFITNPTGPLTNYKIAHEADIFMSLPLIILAIFSIFFGYVTKDIFIGLGSGFFSDNSLFIHPNHEIMINTEFAVPRLFKLLPLLFTVIFSLIAIILSEFYYKSIIIFKFTKIGYNLFSFFNQRFYVELFYNSYVTDVVLKLGGQTTKVLDRGSIELIGPYGLEKGLSNLSNKMDDLGTKAVTGYGLFILMGLMTYVIMTNLSDYNLLIVSMFAIISYHMYIPKKLINPIYKPQLIELQSSVMLISLSKQLNIWTYLGNKFKLLNLWDIVVIFLPIFVSLIAYFICFNLNVNPYNTDNIKPVLKLYTICLSLVFMLLALFVVLFVRKDKVTVLTNLINVLLFTSIRCLMLLYALTNYNIILIFLASLTNGLASFAYYYVKSKINGSFNLTTGLFIFMISTLIFSLIGFGISFLNYIVMLFSILPIPHIFSLDEIRQAGKQFGEYSGQKISMIGNPNSDMVNSGIYAMDREQDDQPESSRAAGQSSSTGNLPVQETPAITHYNAEEEDLFVKTSPGKFRATINTRYETDIFASSENRDFFNNVIPKLRQMIAEGKTTVGPRNSNALENHERLLLKVFVTSRPGLAQFWAYINAEPDRRVKNIEDIVINEKLVRSLERYNKADPDLRRLLCLGTKAVEDREPETLVNVFKVMTDRQSSGDLTKLFQQVDFSPPQPLPQYPPQQGFKHRSRGDR